MRLGCTAATLVVALAAPAAAQSALVEEVQTYGGVPAGAATEHLTRALLAAGYSVRSDVRSPPCGGDLACVRRRARAAGADVAVRAAYLELAGRISVSVELVAATRGRREAAASVNGLDAVEPALVDALRPRAPPEGREVGARGPARWWLGGGAVALLAAGAGALWYARAQRDQFFRDFVDEGGDVVGISAEEARARQARANRWLAAGYVLAGAGAVAGVASIVLFTSGGPSSPGVAFKGTF